VRIRNSSRLARRQLAGNYREPMVNTMAKKKSQKRKPVESERAKSLRRARRICGLTQAQLAEKVGVSRVAVNSWEMGNKYPRDTIIPKLAEALGITPAELVDILDKP
jgi:DNA-binding XRE family transcriptional regulator